MSILQNNFYDTNRKKESLLIDSSGKKIEAIYTPSPDADSPLVLLLHPHPLYGGDMNSKPLVYMEKVFLKYNFTTMRFNFRGTGRSDGEYDNGNGELMDASVCLDWLQDNNPTAKSVCVAGFSFGAYIALQLMVRRTEISYFFSVSTPTSLFDISFVYPCPIDGVFIHAEKDEISSLKDLDKNLKKILKTKHHSLHLEVIKNSNHFFDNNLNKLQSIVGEYTKKYLSTLIQ